MALVSILSLMAVSLKAQESCEGPVTISAGQSAACSCSASSDPHVTVFNSGVCSASVDTWNDYYSCGGNSTAYCDSIATSVGTSTPCVRSTSNIKWIICLTIDPDMTLTTACCWTTCALGTTSTALTRNAAYDWGGDCPYASISKPLQQQLICSRGSVSRILVE